MADSYFLTKTVIDPSRVLTIGGRQTLEQYEALQQFLQARVGREASELFAEPVMSRGNGAAETTVSWYVARSGEGRPLSDLATDTRSAVEAVLGRQLTSVSSALSDPDFGPLLGAALHVDSENSVWVVDGRPFLVGWGMCPPEAQALQSDREAHFAQTIGRYLPIAAVPAITRDEWLSRGYGAAPTPTPETSGPAAEAAPMNADASTGQTMSAEASGTTGAAGPGVASAAGAGAAAGGTAAMAGQGGGQLPPGAYVVEDGGRWQWRWIAPVGLLVLFSLILLWILLPGNLLYPPTLAPSVIEEDAVAEAAREANRTLEERIGELRRAVDGAVCLPDGRLALPDGRTPDGRPAPLPRSTPEGEGEGGDQRAEQEPQPEPRDDGLVEVRPDSLTPQPPNDIVTPPPPEGGDPVPLVDAIESRTVLVVAFGSDGNGGHGTGFVVGPDLILTNHHVVAPALGPGGQVAVTSEHMNRLLQAEVLAQSGPMENNGDDFALLKVQGLGAEPYQLVKADAELKLQQVIAAGYPGYVIETDGEFDFRALLQGDTSHVPDMVMTQGNVTANQRFGAQTNVVIHTADISGGNSGGPLVDSCGRVVGINTFGRGTIRESEGNPELRIAISLNFAIANSDMLEFLQANGVTPQVAAEACTPLVRAQQRPQQQTPEQPTEGESTENEPTPIPIPVNPTPQGGGTQQQDQ